jgi:hypothetical protein
VCSEHQGRSCFAELAEIAQIIVKESSKKQIEGSAEVALSINAEAVLNTYGKDTTVNASFKEWFSANCAASNAFYSDLADDNYVIGANVLDFRAMALSPHFDLAVLIILNIAHFGKFSPVVP